MQQDPDVDNCAFSCKDKIFSSRCYPNRMVILFIASMVFLWIFYSLHDKNLSLKSPFLNQSFSAMNIFNSRPSKMIVISHFNEDLDWLSLTIADKIPYIVYTRSNDPLVAHKMPENKGREAVVYLKYIFDNYEKLPDLVAFIHAHRTSWHQRDPSDAAVALRALRWNKYGYMPLTSAKTDTQFRATSTEEQHRVNLELWNSVLKEELGQPPVNGIHAYCCASFVVKRKNILKHPKQFYRKIYDYILASPHSDQLTGRTLEYTWHMIFGEKPDISFSTCDLFYCDSTGSISVTLAETNPDS